MITIPRQKKTPRTVKEMTTRATDVLTDYTYCDKPQERKRSAICNMTGRLSMNDWNGHFSKPSILRWRCHNVQGVRGGRPRTTGRNKAGGSTGRRRRMQS